MEASYEQNPNFPNEVFSRMITRLYEIDQSPYQKENVDLVDLERIKNRVFSIEPETALKYCRSCLSQIDDLLVSEKTIARISAEFTAAAIASADKFEKLFGEPAPQSNHDLDHEVVMSTWQKLEKELSSYKDFLSSIEARFEDLVQDRESQIKIKWNDSVQSMVDFFILLRDYGIISEPLPGKDLYNVLHNGFLAGKKEVYNKDYLQNLLSSGTISNEPALRALLKKLTDHISKVKG